MAAEPAELTEQAGPGFGQFHFFTHFSCLNSRSACQFGSVCSLSLGLAAHVSFPGFELVVEAAQESCRSPTPVGDDRGRILVCGELFGPYTSLRGFAMARYLP